jgi:EF-P beta-lysylation protein EpmB
MIPAQSFPTQAAPTWQALWRDAISDPRELLTILGLERLAAQVSDAAARQFPLRVPRGFVARMRHGDPLDPLLRQVLPVLDEERIEAGFSFDAVGDGPARAASGVIHKYQGRALLIATGSCAVHCRYCFRRHFPYAEETAAADRWRASLDYLRANPEVSEVLLSGGDPLSLATAKLSELSAQLRGLPQIRRLRLHTRLPVVLPQRVDQELLDWIGALPWPVSVVIHANHAKELDAEVGQALCALRQAGAVLLNQSVLLQGVNDQVSILQDLSERLFEFGVLPYYLHQLDRVSGAAHFEVDDIRARSLHEALRLHLPGYLLPQLVREVAGAGSKTSL